MLSRSLYFLISLVALLSPSILAAQDRYNFLSSLSPGYTYAGGNLSAPLLVPNTIGVTSTNNSFFPSGTGFNGVNGSLSARIYRFVGLAVEFNFLHGSSSNPDFESCSISPFAAFSCFRDEESFHTSGVLYTLLAGPRFAVQLGRFTPFGEALLGAANAMDNANTIGFNSVSVVSREETSYADGLGGGIAFRLSRRIDWRLEADWLQTHFAAENDFGPKVSQHMAQNGWQISTGPSFRVHFRSARKAP
jgi:hypothetical protein